MKRTILLTALLMGFLLGLMAQEKKLDGEWASEKIEDLGNKTFGTRAFVFTGKAWEVKFTLFLDDAKTVPVFRFRGAGNYSTGEKSKKVEGAKEVIFFFDQKYVTLLTDNAEIIKNFGLTSCNLQKGIEKNITETGCSFLPSKTAYGQEYDLVKLVGQKLYLGARSNDMSSIEKRPIALGAPLLKIK